MLRPSPLRALLPGPRALPPLSSRAGQSDFSANEHDASSEDEARRAREADLSARMCRQWGPCMSSEAAKRSLASAISMRNSMRDEEEEVEEGRGRERASHGEAKGTESKSASSSSSPALSALSLLSQPSRAWIASLLSSLQSPALAVALFDQPHYDRLFCPEITQFVSSCRSVLKGE